MAAPGPENQDSQHMLRLAHGSSFFSHHISLLLLQEMAFKVRHLHRHVQQLHDAVLAPAEVPPLLPGLSPEIGNDEEGDGR